MDTRPIGVFDSGIGGLTVVKEIMDILPNEDIVYFGDTARVPYGNKSMETIIKFSCQNSRFLLEKDVKAIVIACNTASSFGLETLEKTFDIPVIGVIRAGVYAAVDATKNKRIGIIGTEGTIGSGAYERGIKGKDISIDTFGFACPLFVPLVEEGWAENKVSYMIAEEYLLPLKKAGIDTLVMGCTHYPLLTKVVGSVMGEGVTLINPAKATALELKNILIEGNLQNYENREPVYNYFVSDNTKKFCAVANNFLDKEIKNIDKIDIEKY